MPLPLTVSCFSKIQIGFTFLVPAHLGSPGKRAVKRVCVCVCVSVCVIVLWCETKQFSFTSSSYLLTYLHVGHSDLVVACSRSCETRAQVRIATTAHIVYYTSVDRNALIPPLRFLWIYYTTCSTVDKILTDIALRAVCQWQQSFLSYRRVTQILPTAAFLFLLQDWPHDSPDFYCYFWAYPVFSF